MSEPNMHRRAFWNDYSSPGMYMLTLVIDGRRPLLGMLRANPHPNVELSPLGRRILKEELPRIPRFYPNVEVWKACIMPDHIHFIIYVREAFEAKKHLGTVVNGFKTGCRRAYHALLPGLPDPLFEANYNDRILVEHADQMAGWKRYLDDNPRRLWLKRTHPDLFTVMATGEIAGMECRMVGNRFLLDLPDKEAVIVHRRYSPAEVEACRKRWLACARRGGVLVSAAIAPVEKEVMRSAMSAGGRVILLRENGFPPLYKPAGEAFDTCVEGRLLIISPWEYHTDKRLITREQCLQLNRLAEAIAGQ